MPIRFRCAYCNQLMGISRRKAGSVVRCPKCAGDIIVPTPDEGARAPEGAAPKPLNETFEDKGLERMLQPSATHAQPDDDEAQAAYLLGSERTFPEALQGLYLSRSALVLAVIGVIALLAVAFGAGFLAGRS
jgi:DNA-directed RNA polymerase subunit RPC12/RpoP